MNSQERRRRLYRSNAGHTGLASAHPLHALLGGSLFSEEDHAADDIKPRTPAVPEDPGTPSARR